jgi:arginyl-tRNA synthetase
VTPGDLDRAVVAAVRAAKAAGELGGAVPERAGLTWEDGGFVTPLPMRLAARSGRTPRQVAETLARRIEQEVTITGPGFLRIEMPEPGALARRIVETGDYGFMEGWAGPTWPDRPRTFGNPGFVVRFAYARAAAIRRHARDLGLVAGEVDGLLDEPAERRLLGSLAGLGGCGAPRYKRQLVLVADAYHDVHERCPALPKGDEPPSTRHRARLTLAEAVRIALNNGLRTLGETPDERL